MHSTLGEFMALKIDKNTKVAGLICVLCHHNRTTGLFLFGDKIVANFYASQYLYNMECVL